MANQQNNSNALTMLVGAIAGIITVAASSGAHDFSDSAIGLIIAILIWPLVKSKKSQYWRLAVSVVGGLCILLVAGVLVDLHLGKTALNYSHFIVWLVGSLGLYYYMPLIEKKQNKTEQEEST